MEILNRLTYVVVFCFCCCLHFLLLFSRRKKEMRGGSVVMDWDQIVRHLTVSSNESQAYRLIDGSHNTFWQSSGPQGKVWREHTHNFESGAIHIPYKSLS